MPLHIVRNDITRMQVEIIVNAANETLRPGGGVCGAIHKAAGPMLARECALLHGCETGSSKMTDSYNLPCERVIHTVGPIWQGGDHGEEAALRSCYKSALNLAHSEGYESIAFPLISSGIFGYPTKEAFRVATTAILDFLSFFGDMRVYLCIFDKSCLTVSRSLFADIREYIDDNYVERMQNEFERRRALEHKAITHALGRDDKDELLVGEYELINGTPFEEDINELDYIYFPSSSAEGLASIGSVPIDSECEAAVAASLDSAADTEEAGHKAPSLGFYDWRASKEDRKQSLDAWLNQVDESFSDTLMRLIEEHGISNAECYKRANIDRKLFSKIKSNSEYKPSKPNALALAVALELSLDETRDLLQKAGYALSHSSIFDLIVEYFIVNNKFDIFEINEVLFTYDQPLLGGAYF